MALRDLCPAPVGHGEAILPQAGPAGRDHPGGDAPSAGLRRLRGLQKDKLPSYLAVTVRNTTYNLLKKEVRDQKLFVPLHAQDLPDDGPTLEEQMLHSEALDELFTICDQLRPIDRELLLRYYLDDWKTPQLADHFGYQPGSVRVRLSRARRQVKQRMLESG